MYSRKVQCNVRKQQCARIDIRTIPLFVPCPAPPRLEWLDPWVPWVTPNLPPLIRGRGWRWPDIRPTCLLHLNYLLLYIRCNVILSIPKLCAKHYAPFQFALLADVKFVLWQALADTFRRLPLPRIQPVPHSCSSLQCVPLCSTSLSHSSRALSQVDPQGGRFLLRRGPARPSVTE